MHELANNWNPTLYNEKHAFVYQFGESLINILDPKLHEDILDLGCGSGELTAQISDRAKSVVGLDLSADMIQHARKQFPKIDFEVGDAANFQFEDSFDAIFSNAALHWIRDYQGAVNSMYRNLKEGGRIVLEFGGKGNVQSIVHQTLQSLSQRGYPTEALSTLWYFPSIAAYTQVLEKKGFFVRFAQHYDRPTELSDAHSGIKDWLSMFAGQIFLGISEEEVEEIKHEVQDNLKSTLFKRGKWYADYKRIRIIAEKP